MYDDNYRFQNKKTTTAVARGGNEGCYLLLVGVSMKNQFGIIGMKIYYHHYLK